MCGFLVSKNKGDNSKIQKRGPDATHTASFEGLKFTHNLLSITGEFTTQPYVNDDIVCVYNGEIYNHKYTKSDGEVIIPLYKKYGPNYAKRLDGEYAIAIYDFSKRIAVFSTDPFSTKPLWVNGIECASYKSGVGGTELPPNTTRVVDIDSSKVIKDRKNVEFDFSQQLKTDYQDWIVAFEEAIRKRAKHGCFIGLSGGYDSGAIACELEKQGIDFTAYSIIAQENVSVINQRHGRGIKGHVVKLSSTDYKNAQDHLKTEAEDYEYSYHGKSGLMSNDKGAVGLAHVCKMGRGDGYKVYLSGQGSDEILSDYSLYPGQSTFKGVFPEDLQEWENFNGGAQRSYIAKEEHVAGSFGIETRYPFLDTKLVQEFLWLTPELKNKHYKAPLYEYLSSSDYPFTQGEKVGFRANYNLT